MLRGQRKIKLPLWSRQWKKGGFPNIRCQWSNFTGLWNWLKVTQPVFFRSTCLWGSRASPIGFVSACLWSKWLDSSRVSKGNTFHFSKEKKPSVFWLAVQIWINKLSADLLVTPVRAEGAEHITSPKDNMVTQRQTYLEKRKFPVCSVIEPWSKKKKKKPFKIKLS